jgi:BASS family bile acid:Na+ symporter
MSTITQFFQTIFQPVAFAFVASNLFVMGLQAEMPQVIAALKNKKSTALILVWGWVLGPAVGLLIVWALPLAEPFALCLLICSMAPCAPFLPPMVAKARGDISYAAAFVPLTAVGTVLFIPLMAPLLIEGVTVSMSALAKSLCVTLFMPLAIGAAIRHYAETVTTKIFPAVKGITALITLFTIFNLGWLYGREMLATAGSFAFLSMTIFMVVMGLITYRFGFGMIKSQRTVMSLGMGTRNVGAAIIVYMALPNPDPLILTMIILWIFVSFFGFGIIARIMGKQAGKTVAGNTI